MHDHTYRRHHSSQLKHNKDCSRHRVQQDHTNHLDNHSLDNHRKELLARAHLDLESVQHYIQSYFHKLGYIQLMGIHLLVLEEGWMEPLTVLEPHNVLCHCRLHDLAAMEVDLLIGDLWQRVLPVKAVDLWLQVLLQKCLLVMADGLSCCYQLFFQRALLAMAVDL